MPGTPPTSPYFGVPRYANTDPADFSTDVNGVTDPYDAALGVRRADVVLASAAVTAGPGETLVVSGAQVVTLPDAPAAQTRVTVVALSGNCPVNAQGTDTITEWSVTGLATITATAKTVVTLRYLSGVWYVVSVTQVAGGDLAGTVDNLTVNTWGGQSKAQVVGGNAPQGHAASHARGSTDFIPGVVPIGGAIIYCGTGDLPAGDFVAADGRLISSTTYATFAGLVQNNFNNGVSPGTGLVRIPDWRGRKPAGAVSFGTDGSNGVVAVSSTDNGRLQYGIGSTGGEVNHLLLAGESGLPSHGHAVSDPQHSHSVYDPGHEHAITDPAHDHPAAASGGQVLTTSAQNVIARAGASGTGSDSLTGASATGITIDSNVTSIGIYDAATGVSVDSVAASNAASVHNNVDPLQAGTVLVRIA